MRALGIAAWLVLVVFGAAEQASAQFAPAPQNVVAFAQRLGLRDVDGFVETVRALRETGRLPRRYVNKQAARERGWRGGGLCEAWPGHAIGGDDFHNFAGKLPAAPHRAYREADLDATCRSRGPKRLVFSNDGLIFLTIDHYNSFVRVP
jgi:hypothetical protein